MRAHTLIAATLQYIKELYKPLKRTLLWSFALPLVLCALFYPLILVVIGWRAQTIFARLLHENVNSFYEQLPQLGYLYTGYNLRMTPTYLLISTAIAVIPITYKLVQNFLGASLAADYIDPANKNILIAKEKEAFDAGVNAGKSCIDSIKSWVKPQTYLYYGTYLAGKTLSENNKDDAINTIRHKKPSW